MTARLPLPIGAAEPAVPTQRGSLHQRCSKRSRPLRIFQDTASLRVKAREICAAAARLPTGKVPDDRHPSTSRVSARQRLGHRSRLPGACGMPLPAAHRDRRHPGSDC